MVFTSHHDAFDEGLTTNVFFLIHRLLQNDKLDTKYNAKISIYQDFFTMTSKTFLTNDPSFNIFFLKGCEEMG